ncbi:glycoside hydrolase family 43 protein [Sphingomonas oryzagri]
MRFKAIAALLVIGAAPAPRSVGPAVFERFSYSGHSLEQVRTAPGEYRNPILSGYYPDPSIVRVGQDYYLVNSSFAHFPGIPVWHSRDLVHWTQIGNAIDRPGQLDFSGRSVSEGVFAPDISYHDGLFYIVNTCVQCGGNYVITARNPAGPWSQPAWLDFDGIDPSLYWEGDKAYLVNNGPPDETPRYDGHRAIWVQEFDPKRQKLVGKRVQIVNGGVDISKRPSWIEGPHLLKHDGAYYLIAAEGGTADNHSEVVFRSDDIFGPFAPFAGNPILTQRSLDPARPHPVTSAGHAMLVQTQKGDWWATFLATRPYGSDLYNIGRETFLLPVTWRDGWPIILPHGEAIPFARQKPALPAQPAPALPTSGDFDYVVNLRKGPLGPAWIGIRTPHAPLYAFRDGGLELSAGAALGDKAGTPAFIGRRQQHAIASVSTILHYLPSGDGGRAGLAAVQNDGSYLLFCLTQIAGKPGVALYRRTDGGAETLVASSPAAGGTVALRIDIEGGTAKLSYGRPGHLSQLGKPVDVTFLSTQKAGGFVGTVIGLYDGPKP